MSNDDETQAVTGPGEAAGPAESLPTTQTACGELPETVEADEATRHFAAPPTPKAPRPPARAPFELPGYELAEEVGRGGMGVVYRAREVAMNREVALKFLLDEYSPDSPTADRFIAEAQITGQLQHPGVPAVYQVGRRSDGRPFLAMKLIKGRTLDTILKSGAALNVPAVFEAIAQAVGYAHAHGVLHRDLKPANVMVGSFGEVQVMDWGLAKVLTADGAARDDLTSFDPEATTGPTRIFSPRDSDGSFTVAGSVLGTPAYMSPEQAAGEIARVDRRSDVFGLGAILCALLTGEPPFSGRNADSVRLAAVRGMTAGAFARLDASGAEIELIDLCKRCLSFEPADRPADASAVAVEIASLRAAADDRARQAELACARAEVQVQEQRKRRRVMQTAAAGVAAVLLMGIGGTTLGLIRAETARGQELGARGVAEANALLAEAARKSEAAQRQIAESAKARSEENLAETRAVLEFVENKIFAAARPKTQAGGLGPQVTLKQAIQAALPSVEQSFRSQPLIEARLRQTLGLSFRYLGEPETARGMLQKARELYEAKLGADHPDTLTSMNRLANIDADLGKFAEALVLHEETLKRRKAVLGPRHVDTIKSMTNVGACYAWLGRNDEALKLREETLELATRELGPEDPETIKARANLAVTYGALGRLDEALKLREQALALFTAKFGPDNPDTLKSLGSLGKSYADLGRPDKALPLREEAFKRLKANLGPDHAETLRSMNDLASTYAALGRYAEALSLRDDTLKRRKAKLGPVHLDTLESMINLADSLIQANRGAEALALLDDCLRLCVGRAVDPRVAKEAMLLRLRHFQESHDADGCRDTVVKWERLGRADADSLYTAAVMHAVVASVVGSPADAAELDAAMARLRKAVAAGYKNRKQIENDRRLDALHARDDFERLVESISKPSSDAAKPETK